MTTRYIMGFTKFDVEVTTKKFGTFKTPVWARTKEAAQKAAEKKWKGQ